jgi:DNA-binding NtrC family response regulator
MGLKRKRRVLAIDDEPSMTEWLKILLEHAGYDVRTALIGTRGEEIFKSWHPDAVITDLMLPDADGIDLVRKFKLLDPEAEVIVVTGRGNIPRSVDAVKAGAFDFLEKPIDAERLLDKLEKALKRKSLVDENEQLKQKLQDRYKFQNVVGKGRKMQELFDLVESVAASEANILIQGENGTGKELIANAIHYNSKRSKGPFIKINCAALPKELIESELFGYKKGAFTGAASDKEGLLEMAEGGSLLLDEIGEMPSYLQTKLLRVLQEREYRPIGSDRIVHVDFRLICATNVDVEAALRDGRLREDLYFRINTITLRVPPLRERTEDIPLLCDYFLDKFRERYQKNVKTLAPAVYHLLIRNRWSGNVRELENAIERAVLVGKGSEIGVQDLPESIRNETTATADFVIPAHRTLAEIEKMAILQTLQRTNWNKQEAAQMLGLYRPTLYSKMKKHDIQDVGKSARAQSAAAASNAPTTKDSSAGL